MAVTKETYSKNTFQSHKWVQGDRHSVIETYEQPNIFTYGMNGVMS